MDEPKKSKKYIVIIVVLLITLVIFDITWFNFEGKGHTNYFYSVKIQPDMNYQYLIRVPTLTDHLGNETEVGRLIEANRTDIYMERVETQYGKAIEINASGSVGLEVSENKWGGSPSMDDHHEFRIYVNSTQNFTIYIALNFSYDHHSEKSNIYGQKYGMWGGGEFEQTAIATISSNSEWLDIEAEVYALNYDGLDGFTVMFGILFNAALLTIIFMIIFRKKIFFAFQNLQ